MRSPKIYNRALEIDEVSKNQIKEVLINHLVLYNWSLDWMRKEMSRTNYGLSRSMFAEPRVSFDRLKKKVIEYANQARLLHIEFALTNELYYLHKKFRKNTRSRKEISDIQYLTFTVSKNRMSGLRLSEDRLTMSIDDTDISFTLNEPFPEITDQGFLYVNISYSNIGDSFNLSIHDRGTLN